MEARAGRWAGGIDLRDADAGLVVVDRLGDFDAPEGGGSDEFLLAGGAGN